MKQGTDPNRMKREIEKMQEQMRKDVIKQREEAYARYSGKDKK